MSTLPAQPPRPWPGAVPLAPAAARAPGAAAPAPGALGATTERQTLEVEGGALFLCDWRDALFVHYAVEPAALQSAVPFELDRHEGRAWVSVVALTVTRLRTRVGGRLLGATGRGQRPEHLVEVRTYVRFRGQRGTCPLARWGAPELGEATNPHAYGLPWRGGRLDHCHDPLAGHTHGVVVGDHASCRSPRLRYQARTRSAEPSAAPEPGSRADFLLNRYITFTGPRRGPRRRFCLWHEPWTGHSADAQLVDEQLLATTGSWLRRAQPAGAHFCPGVGDVWIGRPQCLEGRFADRAWPRARMLT